MEKIVVIGGSAGSFKIIHQLIGSLPSNFRYPVVLCLHRLRNVRNGFAEALQNNTKLPLNEPYDMEIIKGGRIYLAPSNYHLMFDQDNRFALSVSEPVNHSRPSIDICFETAAEIFGNRVIGVVLSGANIDGAKGLAKVKKEGGLTIVQNPGDSEIQTMPDACLNLFKPDHVLDSSGIISFISNLK